MIWVIDNYDSFTHNLVQYLGQCGEECHVVRNDELTIDDLLSAEFDGILMSPGPCTPSESGVCLDIVRVALDSDSRLSGKPVFGVCLGHQTIGQVSGGTVRIAKTIMHGKASMVKHDGQGCLAGLPNPFQAIRYHSLVVDEESIPSDFVVTARSEDDGEVMAMRHKELPIEGVQFHPESILTDHGLQIVQNFVNQVRARA
ncbi:MAG: aminodeoxychorismate/anthranilate synthase component II [Armatimonadetes bacterium]|nr:aminodeoxychorismate/anthranilate synthase component II [Armatimonadota bacterium]